jgi:K+-sensing histidine kinase KdpD
MEQWESQLSKPLTAIQGYGLAIFSVSSALGASVLLRHLHFTGVETPLFLFAAAITAWYGGVGPAAVALVISCVSFDYFFVEPLYSLVMTRADIPYLFRSRRSRCWSLGSLPCGARSSEIFFGPAKN